MAVKIALSAGVKSNLLTLQKTASSIATTQTRLSSGLKVNSALDNASAYFTSVALNNRASDLSTLKSDIDLSVSTIESAINGIDAITELVQQAKGLANQAKATGDTSERSTLATQFNELLNQIDDLANDSSFNGTNLLQATPDNLTVTFNEDNTSNLTITGLDSTTASTGLSITAAAAAIRQRHQYQHCPDRAEQRPDGAAYQRRDAGFEQHCVADASGFHHIRRQHAGNGCRQVDAGGPERGKRQPAGPADQAAARH